MSKHDLSWAQIIRMNHAHKHYASDVKDMAIVILTVVLCTLLFIYVEVH